MKKVISFFTALLITGIVYAQNIDTVYIRNLTLQAGDWAWLVGKASFRDSAGLKDFRKIRSVIQANIPPNWTTNVNIDSLSGRTVYGFYQLAKTSNAGEIVSRYTAITNAILLKTNLSYWLGLLDGSLLSDYDRNRNLGKNRLIDQ